MREPIEVYADHYEVTVYKPRTSVVLKFQDESLAGVVFRSLSCIKYGTKQRKHVMGLRFVREILRGVMLEERTNEGVFLHVYTRMADSVIFHMNTIICRILKRKPKVTEIIPN